MNFTNSRYKKYQSDLRLATELVKLMKPRVMSLVIFTCAVGLLSAPTNVDFEKAVIGIFIAAIGAGAAGALNMWYEADSDKLMSRTCLRPIPTGRVNKNLALFFWNLAVVLISLWIVLFYKFFVCFFIIFYNCIYLFVYTIWLKRKTPQNIVIGGASGALPPVIGWTIATNSLSIEPIAFFNNFFWTPSHFWALSLYKANDYKKANSNASNNKWNREHQNQYIYLFINDDTSNFISLCNWFCWKVIFNCKFVFNILL